MARFETVPITATEKGQRRSAAHRDRPESETAPEPARLGPSPLAKRGIRAAPGFSISSIRGVIALCWGNGHPPFEDPSPYSGVFQHAGPLADFLVIGP